MIKRVETLDVPELNGDAKTAGLFSGVHVDERDGNRAALFGSVPADLNRNPDALRIVGRWTRDSAQDVPVRTATFNSHI